jgi:hypothetical protein
MYRPSSRTRNSTGLPPASVPAHRPVRTGTRCTGCIAKRYVNQHEPGTQRAGPSRAAAARPQRRAAGATPTRQSAPDCADPARVTPDAISEAPPPIHRDPGISAKELAGAAVVSPREQVPYLVVAAPGPSHLEARRLPVRIIDLGRLPPPCWNRGAAADPGAAASANTGTSMPTHQRIARPSITQPALPARGEERAWLSHWRR